MCYDTCTATERRFFHFMPLPKSEVICREFAKEQHPAWPEEPYNFTGDIFPIGSEQVGDDMNCKDRIKRCTLKGGPAGVSNHDLSMQEIWDCFSAECYRS